MSSASASRRRRRSKSAAAARSEMAAYQEAADALKSLSGFDAANQSTRRSYIYWPTLDTKREIDSYSRTEMLRKSRFLRANYGLPTRICSGLSDLIGYLTPISMSGDPDWDELADDHWEDRAGSAEVIDAAGQFDIRRMQIELNKAAFGDGDILPVLIRTESDGIMLANYEAHQLASPQGSDSSWVDGVKINKFRRHVAYGLRDDSDPSKIKTIAANDALYFSHPDATGRIRPPTILAHAINHMLDIGEILADVKLTIKVAAQLGLYLKNDVENSGGHQGPRDLASSVRDERLHDGSGTTADPASTYKVEDIYRATGGLANLPKGTTIGVIQDARPHPNQVALLEYLVRDICWGVGVSPEMLWDIAKLGGANTRIMNADLDRWIASRLLRLKGWLKRFRAIWIANEIKAGRLPEPSGSGKFWQATFIPQASITADKGRVGKLNIELVKNNLRSLQTHFAEEGGYWLKELRQMAKEKKALSDLGLTIDEILKNSQNSQSA